jgi:hypothetical protein
MPETATCWISASNITISSDNQVSATKNETGAESSESGDVSISVEKTEPETNNQLTLAELEGIWEKMTSEPVMGAEVLPLRDMYDEMLSTSSGDIVVEQVACGRIKQLDVWAGLQDQRMRINVLRLKLAKRSEDFVDLHTSISNDAYALSGRLGLSNTFDGNLRPFMYRIQDERSGRTLGYLPKNDAFELTDLVGHTVGIIGTRKWNPTWRINTVDIKRVDLLSPTTAIAAPDIQ